MKISLILTIIFMMMNNYLLSEDKIFLKGKYFQDMDLHLGLLNNHNYIMNFWTNQEGVSISTFFTFSFGSYRIKSDTVYFEDDIFNFKMKAKISSTSYPVRKEFIEFFQGFSFLNNTPIFQSYSEWSKSDIKIFYSDFIKQDLISHNSFKKKYAKLKIQTKEFEFKYGIYSIFQISDYYYKIEFKENKTYSYKFHGEIISEGKWQRDKNIITLNDKIFSVKYHIAVSDSNKLIAIHLPMFYDDNIESRTFNFVKK